MASTMYFYDSLFAVQNAGLNLESDTVKVMLVLSDYTFSATHANKAAVLAAGTEAASGDGYTTGGESLANKALTVTSSPQSLAWDADNVVWTALTKTFRWLIYYVSGTVNGITDPVLLAILPDNSPADVVVSGVDYAAIHSSLGILTWAKKA